MKKMRSVAIAISIAAAVAAPGIANADDVAFSTDAPTLAGAKAVALGAETSNCGVNDGKGPFTLIRTATLSNAGSPKDLVLGFSAATTIFTSTEVASKNGSTSSSMAEADLEVCVETVSGDGTKIAAPGVVTFDRRKQELWAKLTGLNCTANLTTGVVTCADDEIIGLALDTTAAHHFNFIAQNPGPNEVTVNAYARVTCSTSSIGTTSQSCSNNINAAIEKASLVVFEVQASNH